MTKKKLLLFILIAALFISYPIYLNLNNIPKNWTLKEFQNQDLKWKPCYYKFECTTFLVPVDYENLTGDVFHLKVIRFSATDQRNRLGALIVNPGGPGASAFDYAYNAESIVSSAIRERYDIVGFDQRGAGRSDPIRCLSDKETDRMLGGPMIADTPENQRKMLENAKFFASRCKKAAGTKLEHLSTLESAKDMELLRLALNEPNLNYLGKSYGTYLGTLYASLYPIKVGKMVLDGAINPSIPIQEQNLTQAKGFELALNQFLIENKFSKVIILNLLKKLQIEPLWTKSERELNDSLAILGIASALYDDVTGWPKLASALSQAFIGDGTLLLKLSDEYSDRGKNGNYFSNENDIAPIISCLDWAHKRQSIGTEATLQKFSTAAPIFGLYLANSDLVCKYLFSHQNIKIEKIDLEVTTPIMIIGTTRDPATPLEWSIALSKKLPGSILITLNTDGHTGQGRGFNCVDSTVDKYFLVGKNIYSKNIICDIN